MASHSVTDQTKRHAAEFPFIQCLSFSFPPKHRVGYILVTATHNSDEQIARHHANIISVFTCLNRIKTYVLIMRDIMNAHQHQGLKAQSLFRYARIKILPSTLSSDVLYPQPLLYIPVRNSVTRHRFQIPSYFRHYTCWLKSEDGKQLVTTTNNSVLTHLWAARRTFERSGCFQQDKDHPTHIYTRILNSRLGERIAGHLITLYPVRKDIKLLII